MYGMWGAHGARVAHVVRAVGAAVLHGGARGSGAGGSGTCGAAGYTDGTGYRQVSGYRGRVCAAPTHTHVVENKAPTVHRIYASEMWLALAIPARSELSEARLGSISGYEPVLIRLHLGCSEERRILQRRHRLIRRGTHQPHERVGMRLGQPRRMCDDQRAGGTAD